MRKSLRWAIALAPIVGIAAFAAFTVVTTADAPDAQDADLLMVLPPWPDLDNAVHWTDLLRAQWPLTADEDDELRDWLYADDCRWNAAHAHGIVAKLAPVRPLVDRALRCSAAHARSWVPAGRSDHFTHLLGVVALDHARAGRTGPALTAALDLVALGSLSLRPQGPIYQYLNGWDHFRLGLAMVREVVTLAPPEALALEDAVRRLAALAPNDATLTHALRAHYTYSARRLDQLAVPDPSEDWPGTGYRFLPNATKLELQRDVRPLIAGGHRPLRTQRARGDRSESSIAVNRWIANLGPNVTGKTFVGFAVDDAIDLPWKATVATADLRATRVALALLAHRQRTGRLPASLAELAPILDGEVPVDPFDGAPIRYDVARRLVWVVGLDPTDGDGTPSPWNARVSVSRFDDPDPGWQLPE